MSQGKIKALTDQILLAVGVPAENIQQLKGLYAARRVLPTLAHRAKFSEPERIDVGGWSAGGRLAIAQRYSEAKCDEQADLRSELVLLASQSLCTLIERVPLPNPVQELEWSWTEVWQYFPKRESAPVACSAGVAFDWCMTLYPLSRMSSCIFCRAAFCCLASSPGFTDNCRHPRREPDVLNVPTYGHDKNIRYYIFPPLNRS